MDISSIVIKLVRRGGISEPNYSIIINGDGSVIYEGIKNVSVKTRVEENIGEEKVLDLLSDLKESGFFSVEDNFEVKEGSNIPIVELSFNFKDDNDILKKKNITHHSLDPKLPFGLKSFEDKIDEVVGSKRFIEGKNKDVKKIISKRSVNKKPFFIKNKKPLIGLICVIIALVLVSALFVSGVFDSKDITSEIGDGNDDTNNNSGDNTIDENDNNNDDENTNGDDNTEEYPNPEIFFITPTSQSNRIGDQRSAKTTNFIQGDTVYVDFEFRNVTHNNSYYLNIGLLVTNNNDVYYQDLSSYNRSDASNTEFFMILDIPTDESWEVERTYDVKITLNDLISGKNDEATDSFYLSDIDSPEPELFITTDPSPPVGTDELEVDFYCTVYNLTDDISYYWNFGDGSSSSSKNPTHTYTEPGEYSASLTVIDSSDVTISSSVDVTVNEGEKIPYATFTVEPASGYAPLSVVFTAITENLVEPVSFEWDLDSDGSIDSTNKQFTHIYEDPCDQFIESYYNATLNINDNNGYSEVFYFGEIEVLNYLEDVDFSVDNSTSEVDSTVTFDADKPSNGNGPYTYHWDFDYDLNEQNFVEDKSGKSVTYAYQNSGWKTIKLKVIDDEGNIGIKIKTTVYVLS